jgi:hypothetical protein
MPEPPVPTATSHRNLNPIDVCLLLRAHAEELWLRRRVLPIVEELESQTADGDLGAALAYLEVLWLDAMSRAAETDAAAALLAAYYGNCTGSGDGGASGYALGPSPCDGDALLCAEARRLHASVRLLRERLGPRVRSLTFAPRGACWERAAR